MTSKANHGYDPDIIIASRQTVDVIHLKVDGKEVGRYCKCGCGKKITGKKVKRYHWRSKRVQEYELPPMPQQVYATRGCMIRDTSKRQGTKWNAGGYNCRLNFKVELIKNKPTRKLTVYMGKRMKKEFLITEKEKELWSFLERVSRYTINPVSNTKIKNLTVFNQW